MWNFSKIVPEHWRSTDAQTRLYLANTAQAKMFREGEAHKKSKARHEFDSLLPTDPVNEHDAATLQHYSLRKKFAAGALAAATVLASGGQYAAAQHNQPSQPETTTSTSGENECYSSFVTNSAQTTTEIFTIVDAGNDALTEAGKSKIQAEFEQSSVLDAAKNYINELDPSADVSIEVVGMASDDNRQNTNAGIGEKDQINEKTARSYAAIATGALKKLFTNKNEMPAFTQSAKEMVLRAEQQQQLQEIQADAQSQSKVDLLTAYNDVNSALSEKNRQAMDELIGVNRGVEITVVSTTPETVTESTVCLSDSEVSASPQIAQPAMYGDPKAILPEWSHVTKKFQSPKTPKRYDDASKSSVGTRIKRRSKAMRQGLLSDVATFSEDAAYIGNGIKNGIAGMGSEAGDSIKRHYDTWVRNKPDNEKSDYTGYIEQPQATRRQKLLQPLKNTIEHASDQLQATRASTHDKAQQKRAIRNHKAYNRTPLVKYLGNDFSRHIDKAKKFATIPSAAPDELSRQDFYSKYRQFPEDARTANKKVSTRLARLIKQNR